MAANPSINGFVLYAERNLRVGRHDMVGGGDLGVHAIAKPDSRAQAEIAERASIEPDRTVFSPSIALGAMCASVRWRRTRSAMMASRSVR
jgi:hypothetical protein